MNKETTTTPLSLNNVYVPFFVYQILEHIHVVEYHRPEALTDHHHQFIWKAKLSASPQEQQQQQQTRTTTMISSSSSPIPDQNNNNNDSDERKDHFAYIKVNRCSIMGYITSVDYYLNRKVTLTVDDGTGHSIKCIQWFSSDDQTYNHTHTHTHNTTTTQQSYTIGQLIELKGRLHYYKKFKQIVIERVNKVSDNDQNGHLQECHFWIQCIKNQQAILEEEYARIRLERQQQQKNNSDKGDDADERLKRLKISDKVESWFGHMLHHRITTLTDEFLSSSSSASASSNHQKTVEQEKKSNEDNCAVSLDDDTRSIHRKQKIFSVQDFLAQSDNDSAAAAAGGDDEGLASWMDQVFAQYEQWLVTLLNDDDDDSENNQGSANKRHVPAAIQGESSAREEDKKAVLLRVLNRLLDSNYIIHIEWDNGAPRINPCMIIDTSSHFQCITLRHHLLIVIEEYVRSRQKQQQLQQQRTNQSTSRTHSAVVGQHSHHEDGVPLSFIYTAVRSMREFSRISDQMFRECIEYMINESIMYETSRHQCYKVIE